MNLDKTLTDMVSDLLKKKSLPNEPQISFVQRKTKLEESIFGGEQEWSLDLSNNQVLSVEEREKNYNWCLEKMLKLSDHTPNFNRLDGRVQLLNGGMRYKDQIGVFESCLPETLTMLDLLRYERAEEREVFELAKKVGIEKVYKTTRGMQGNEEKSAGAHQSIFGRIAKTEAAHAPLLLWSVVEKLITGSGYLHPNGEYSVTQRADFITCAIKNGSTDGDRPLLNLRGESLSAANERHRFHHISNDASISDWAIANKYELWRCVLQLAAVGKLPNIPYWSNGNYDQAVRDLKQLSDHHLNPGNWILQGTPVEFRSVLAVLDKYHEVMRIELYGQNSFTDSVIDKLHEIKSGLRKIHTDRYALFGSVDWVTRLWFIENGMSNFD